MMSYDFICFLVSCYLASGTWSTKITTTTTTENMITISCMRNRYHRPELEYNTWCSSCIIKLAAILGRRWRGLRQLMLMVSSRVLVTLRFCLLGISREFWIFSRRPWKMPEKFTLKSWPAHNNQSWWPWASSVRAGQTTSGYLHTIWYIPIANKGEIIKVKIMPAMVDIYIWRS